MRAGLRGFEPDERAEGRHQCDCPGSLILVISRVVSATGWRWMVRVATDGEKRVLLSKGE